MEIIVKTAVRSLFTYVFVVMLTRLMGRKLISQMTFFDFVVGITLGAVSANLAMGPNSNFSVATTVLVIFAALSILTGYLHTRSLGFQKLVNSEPVTVIANGKIIEENFGRMRFSLSELLMKLREKSIFNPADVEFAIMETDGNLSVQKKSQKVALTPSDLGLSTSYTGLTKDLIMDGSIMTENLKDIGLDSQWLQNKLVSQGVASAEAVFYAGLDTAGNLYVSLKEKRREKHGVYGIE